MSRDHNDLVQVPLDADAAVVQAVAGELRRQAARWARAIDRMDSELEGAPMYAAGVRHVAEELARDADDLEWSAARHWYGYATAGAL